MFVKALSVSLLTAVVLLGPSASHGGCSPLPREAAAGKLAEVSGGTKQSSEEVSRFLERFLQLPPGERVKIWRHGQRTLGYEENTVDKALVARGMDAVPFLADIVRKDDAYYQAFALHLLCDMDRFVPIEQFPIPEFGHSSNPFVRKYNFEGVVNRFIVVDGRRIGKEGYEVVKWAAEQEKDKDLRFHARQYSGLLEQDLRALPLDLKLEQWRKAVAKCKGLVGADVDALNLSQILRNLLIEAAPQSIPALVKVMESDPNPFVREAAIEPLQMIDQARMRLRGSEAGRTALEAIHKVLDRGGLNPFM
jgi:hypothetical protein